MVVGDAAVILAQLVFSLCTTCKLIVSLCSLRLVAEEKIKAWVVPSSRSQIISSRNPSSVSGSLK